MDENKIDVFQDEDTKQKEIFVDYSNEPKNPKEVSTKTAMIAIVATFIVLLIIGGAFTAGFFTAKSTGIEGDMPLLEKAYEYVKYYYYQDISFSEFQETASLYMVSALDKFSGATYAQVPAGEYTFGYTESVTDYNEHIIAKVVQSSPMQEAIAKTKCTIPTYTQGSLYKYVEYTVQENVEESKIKVGVGDKLVAISFNGIQPIYVEGLSSDAIKSLYSSADTDTFTFYFAPSDGEGHYPYDYVYKYIVTRRFVTTKHAFLYTPEEIGDTTGTTAMIVFDSFSGSAIKDFHDCAQAFVDAGYTKLILDLRANGGGDEAILQYLGGCLIKGAEKDDKDIIKYVKNSGKGKFVTEYVKSTKAGTYESDEEVTTYNAVNLPALVEGFNMTILCNGNTASSSEALIGALMYYNNAEIIGRTTYGKGVGQVVIRFTEKYNLIITNGKYYIPTDSNGDGITEWDTSIHGVGFIPKEENTIDKVVRPISTDKAIKRALTLLNS